MRLGTKSKSSDNNESAAAKAPELPIEKPVSEILEAIMPIKSKEAKIRWSSVSKTTMSMKALGMLAPKGPRKSVVPNPQGEASARFTRVFAEQKNDGAAQSTLIRMLLEEFRRRMFEKYVSPQEAFDAFDVDGDGSLTPKEWDAAIARTGMGSVEEAQGLFGAIDTHCSGRVSSLEFHTAIESVSPVRTLEDLRKRLLRWYSSTLQGIIAMDPVFVRMEAREKRNSLQEFSACLAKIQVNDPEDQKVIFQLLINPYEPSGKVSLSELVAALTVVSPVLLLEDLRDRFLRKYGSLEKGYDALDIDKGGELDYDEFVKGVIRLGIPRTDAQRMFRLIDIDGSGNIDKGELISALRLTSRHDSLEDFRRKLRQRFTSIKEALEEEAAYSGRDLDLAKFQEILEPLDISKRDTQRIFDLIDSDGDKTLSVDEFMRGVRIFAPSTLLEGIRTKIVKKYGEIPLAFKDVENLSACMTIPQFQRVLEEKGLACLRNEELQTVFDVISVNPDQGLSVNELIVALVAAQPGLMAKLSTPERNHRVRGNVKQDLNPLQKSIVEMKQQLRLGLPDDAGGEHENESKDSKKGASRVPKRDRKIAETTFYQGGGVWRHRPIQSSVDKKGEGTREFKKPQ